MIVEEEQTRTKTKLEQLGEDALAYVETRIELVVLDVAERAANAAASAVSLILLLAFILLILFFSGMGVAIWLGGILNNPAAGYFIVAAFFIVSLVLLQLFAGSWVRDTIINKTLEEIQNNDKKNEQ